MFRDSLVLALLQGNINFVEILLDWEASAYTPTDGSDESEQPEQLEQPEQSDMTNDDLPEMTDQELLNNLYEEVILNLDLSGGGH